MKKLSCILMGGILLIALSGCDAISAQPGAELPPAAPTREDYLQADEPPSADGIDFDFTTMSDTIVTAQVLDMMWNPDAYVGKVFKMYGEYYSKYFEQIETQQHYIIINDATGCCPQGIEIVAEGAATYPAQNEIIEIVGTFERAEIGGLEFYRVVTEDVTVLP